MANCKKVQTAMYILLASFSIRAASLPETGQAPPLSFGEEEQDDPKFFSYEAVVADANSNSLAEFEKYPDTTINYKENPSFGIVHASRQRRSLHHGLQSGGIGLWHGQSQLVPQRPILVEQAYLPPPPPPPPVYIQQVGHHVPVSPASQAQAQAITAQFGGLGISGAAASAAAGPVPGQGIHQQPVPFLGYGFIQSSNINQQPTFISVKPRQPFC